MNYNKTVVALSLCSVFASASADTEFMAIIGVENSVAEKISTIEKNISNWQDHGNDYDCSVWNPHESTVNYGKTFEQSQVCSQDQFRTKDIYTVYDSGAEVYEKTDTEHRTIDVTNKQNSIGTKNYKDNEKPYPWGEWVDEGSHYDCDTWTPNKNTVDYGKSFTQTRNCSQDQSRTRDVYDVWADGSETFNRTETSTRTISEIESQSEIGTQNFISFEEPKEWSEWEDKNGHYDCDTWTPNVSTIPYGDEFTQTRNCSQDQERERDIYDVWADGSETYNRTETGYQTITEEESQIAVGTQNFIDSTRNDPWSSWENENGHYDCLTWTPDVSSIPYGDSFTQTRDCSQDQTRTRDVYDVWADGTETYNKTETDNQTITEQESQLAIGTQNFIDTTRNGEWTNWVNKNNHYDCDTWTPDVTTIPYGDSFTQTRDCKQDQERTREVYDVWADGTETLNKIETDTQTIIEEESQSAIGTQNFIDTTRNDTWSSWSNIGVHYDCEVWNPDVTTIPYGDSFTQTRDCSQDQLRSRNVYDVWADGTETLNRVETETQTITEAESQSAVGTQNFIDTTRNGEWTSWTDKNGHYACDTWTPDVSTVPYGDSFIQTRNCSQDQERTREIYDVWADGSETLNRVETDSQTITEQESQPAIGTENFIDSTRNGNWTSWTDKNGHYDCAIWNPDVATKPYGESFTQTRDCSQDQTRTREVYDVWADGSETLNRVETDNQTITETESQSAVGTQNYIDTTRNGAWSAWTDKNGHYDCDTWTPNVATKPYGESFTQTRDCSQDQERTRTVYNVWADGTETVKTTETDNQTITETESQSAVGTKNFIDTTRNGDWTNWSDTGSHYDCEIWNPNVNTIDYGKSFTQTRDCSQNQIRSREVYDVWADGTETLNRVETDNQTITETESQSAIGAKNFIDTTRNGEWTSWTDTGSHYACNTWTPSVTSKPYGESFTQTRDCSQDQERTREIYDVWADGSETLNKIETGTQTITETESQSAIGTQNYIDTTRNGAWSTWSDKGNQFNCSSWSPSPSTINYNESFTQTQNCSQEQTRTRTVYNVWADGTETVKTTETDTQTINETNSRSAIGTKNYKTGTVSYDSWTNWTDTGSHYDCKAWTPSTSTIDYGNSFTQTRDCSQNQERTRNVYDDWADGTRTHKSVEKENKVITETESQSAVGTKNYIDTTRNGNWSAWSDSGNQYNCSTWSPATSTVNLGTTFEQSQDCKQNQTRSRTVYNVWADGTETVKTTETDSQTITETNKRNATGSKNYITTTRTGDWSSWTDKNGHYACDTWSPNVNTIDYGQSFTQTRDCKQDQTRTRTIYNVWADGSETVKNTETGNQTIIEQESKGAVGTKNYIDTTRNGNWSAWSDSGNQYNCSTWSPSTSTVNLGTTFEQSQDCKQNQTRSRTVYNVWADGTETVKTTETDSQTINETNKRNATGSKNYITTTRTGDWSAWTDKNGHYACDTWSPNVSTKPYGESFTQTRDCKQDQTRTRTIYNVWADGSETVKNTETGNQTITETESQSAIGTQNFVSTTRNGAWSSWTDSGNQYSCSTWSPSTSTVNLGSTFEQTQDCKQNQTRSRTVYNVWADGTETVKTTESESKTITETNKRNATGSKNYITTTRTGNWSSWTDSGGHYDCGTWSPSVSSKPYGESFTQTRSCKQNQTRSRTIYNVWADGSETVKNTETGNQTINETESQAAVGTQNYVIEVEYDDWSTWEDVGNQYNCSIWTPDAADIAYGVSFTQTQTCQQAQERERTVYDIWANGAITINTVEKETKSIWESNSVTAVGTKNWIVSSNTEHTPWANSGETYDCDSWTPDPSTIDLGVSFDQERECKQNQTRTQTTYDNWADGTQTVNNVQTNTQTVNITEYRVAIGEKPVTGTWVKKTSSTKCGYGWYDDPPYPTGTCTIGDTYKSDTIAGTCGNYPLRETATWKCE